jgi:hypothetical protein
MQSQTAPIGLLFLHLILNCNSRSYQKQALHTLGGRPALVYDENVVLQRLDIPSFRTIHYTSNTHSRQQHQFLVRVDTKWRAEVLALLQRSSQYVRYLPYDTILVALTPQELSILSSLNRVVYVFELPSSMKMRPDLQKGIRDAGASDAFLQQLIRRRESSGKCEQIKLMLDLISTVDDVPSLEPEIVALCSEKVSNRSLCELISGASTRNKLVVNTDECLRDLAAQRLAEHPAVAWVEVQAKMRLRNKYATRILQSENGSSWTLWDKGLKGNGEVRMLTRFNFIVVSV